MEIRPIRTEQDYRTALTEISQLIDKDPAPGTPDGDRLDILGTLVEAYEARHYPIAPRPYRCAAPAHGVPGHDGQGPGALHRADQPHLRNTQPQPPLTLNMLYRLHDLGIPAESLLSRPRTAAPESHG